MIFATVAYVLGGGVSTGDFVAFNTAFAQFLFASAGITTAFTTILQAALLREGEADPAHPARGGYGEARPWRAERPGRDQPRLFPLRPRRPARARRRLVARRAWGVRRDRRPVWRRQVVAFRQLLGFEEPEAGSVYYDHHNLAELNVQAVRRQMGVVLQNGRLMSGTIFQNIAGVSALTMDQAWEAARMAGLDEDIEMMPMGMFTFLGEGSSAISGGQRQRLMIARAIASRPRILLDEATSALDNRSQAIVSSSLQDLKATCIVIAHRLSTIISADRIYVLKAGRIVQSGTYEELMERRGRSGTWPPARLRRGCRRRVRSRST